VPARVVFDGEALGIDAAVLEHVARREVGRGQVVVAGGGEDAQRLVVLRPLRERAGHVDEAGERAAAVRGPLPLLIRLAVLREIAPVGLDAQLVAQVGLEQRDVNRAGLRAERIAVRILAGVVELVLHVAPVEQADRLPFLAQQLLGEADGVDAQIAAQDVLLRQAGEAAQLVGDALLLRLRQVVSLEQRDEVVGAGELLGLAQQRLAVFPLVGQLPVIPGGGRERGKVRREREVVAGGDERQRAHVERGRDEHDAVEADRKVALHARDEQRGADAAIALAEDVLRGVPAIVLRDVGADEVGDGVGVLVVAPEILVLLLAHRAAVAGADGIDEHEVGGAEDRGRVVAQLVRRRARIRGIARDVDHLRTDEAEVQPHRCRARTAVEDERDRALFRARAVLRVGDREEAGGVLPRRVLQEDLLGRRRVRDVLRADLQPMLFHELQRLGRLLRRFLGRLLRRLRVLGEQRRGANSESEEQSANHSRSIRRTVFRVAFGIRIFTACAT